jgi:hypothetical protein
MTVAGHEIGSEIGHESGSGAPRISGALRVEIDRPELDGGPAPTRERMDALNDTLRYRGSGPREATPRDLGEFAGSRGLVSGSGRVGASTAAGRPSALRTPCRRT